MSNLMCFENSYVDIENTDGGRRISYMRCDPPARLKPKGTILLLHDVGKSNDQFAEVIDLFAMGGYHTIAPDVPSQKSYSQIPNNARSTASDLSVTLTKFVDGLEVSGSLHLIAVGESIASALQLVAGCPDMVNTVVTVNIGSGDSGTATATSSSQHQQEASQDASSMMTLQTNINDCPEATPESFLIRALSFINKHNARSDQQIVKSPTSVNTKARL